MSKQSRSTDFKYSNNLSNIKHLVPFYGQFMLLSIQILDHNIWFDLKSKARFGICPSCKKESRSEHSKYYRYLQDTPMHTRQVMLKLHLHKYYCKNPTCSKKVFAESTDLTERYARNTPRADKQITDLSLKCSSITCSNQLHLQGIQSSPSSCIRKLLKLTLPEYKASIIGIDDFAYKKGHNYGTVVVNQTTHAPIDLFDGRDTPSIELWLRKHPEIKTITRDGGLCFKKAISNVSPNIEQIRDRYHLMQDFSLYINRFVKRILDKKSKQTHKVLPLMEDIHNLIWQHILGMGNASQKQKNKRHVSVHELYSKGYKAHQIAERLKINCSNINRYLLTQTTKYFSSQQLIIYKHIEEISLLFSEGKLTNTNDIIDKYPTIEQKSLVGLDCKITACAEAVNINKKKIYSKENNKVCRKEIFKTFFQEGYITEHQNLKKILKEEDRYHKFIKLCHYFRLLMNQSPAPYTVKEWIKKAFKLKIRELSDFARMLSKDLDAIENAVDLSLNNGLLEGTVNKIKAVKRAMYGRASVKLLKMKLILQSST